MPMAIKAISGAVCNNGCWMALGSVFKNLGFRSAMRMTEMGSNLWAKVYKDAGV